MQQRQSSVSIARVSGFLVVALGPAALIVSGVISKGAGRTLLVLGAAAALICLSASVLVVRRNSQAWVLILGSVCVLGGGIYLWSVRNVPAAIPIGGFLAIVLGLVLLVLGGLVVRPEPSGTG